MPSITPLRADDPERIGRYRPTGRISGMPGTGPAYLAMTADSGEVTLRLLRGSWTRDAAARDRFVAEAGSAGRVPPFCAARILDAGVHDDYAYLVSEYVAGRSLLETVSDDGGLTGPMLEALAIGSATGLASVHQAGLVHGNFGPEYVIMSAAGPRIIEYGITPPYGSATPAADMLAWAQTMVFAAIGKPPTTRADLDALPGDLRGVAAACLAGDPATRPTARNAVLDLLDDAEPPAGVLAEGLRRAALAGPSARPRPGGRAGPGGRARPGERARPGGPGHRQAASGQGRPRGGRWAIGLVIAAVVIIAGVVAAHELTRAPATGPGGPGPRHAQRATTSGATPTASGSPSPSAGTVPAALAGTWSGQANQVNPPDTFAVRLTISAGAAGGRVAYSGGSFSCTGDLRLESSGHGALTLRQDIVRGKRECANGMVTLASGPDGTLRFSFRGRSGPAAGATLRRAAA